MSIKATYSAKSIKSFETYDWLMNKHYARRIPSISYAFGLYDNDGILQGVCTFGKPASPSLCDGICGRDHSHNVYELNRLVINEICPDNTASFFISKCLKLLPKNMIIVSYADTRMGHIGKIYQATNWIYTGATAERTDIGSEDGSHSRHYDKNQDYKLNRKHRSSKHRYVYFTGIKYPLNYKIQPYPKGETMRYDASYTPQTQTNLF
jgi:hypothetical protein